MFREKDSLKDISIASHQYSSERDYWLNRLAGELNKSSFPYDYLPGKERDKPAGAKIEFTLGQEVSQQLMKLSKGYDYSLHMLVVAAVVALLGRYTGHRDLIVGMPIYRQDSDEEFVNTVLALRNRLEDHLTFKELLLQVRQTIVEADQNQNYGLETLLYQLDLPVNTGDFPLFDTAVLLENVHDKGYLEHLPLNTVFCFLRRENDIQGVLEYNPGRYREETARRLVAHLLCLLERFLTDVNLRVAGVEFLAPAEKQQLLLAFNDTAGEFPGEKTVVELFQEQETKTPDRAALTGQRVSLAYRELNRKSNRLARLLRQKGVKPNHLVGIMTDRTVNTVINIMAILKSGGAYLPLDPETPTPRNNSILEDAGLTVVLTADTLAGELPCPGEANPAPVNRSTDLAYCLFTSGSSGGAKGVLIRHRNLHYLVRGLRERVYQRYPANRYLKVGLVSPFVFDASVKQVFAALLQGHGLCIVPEEVRVDLGALLEYYRRHSPDLADGTPAHLGMLAEAMKENPRGPGVKQFLIGGEALTGRDVEGFFNRFPAGTPLPVLTNVYGPTECTVDTTAYDIGAETPGQFAIIPLGKPLPHCRVYILDRGSNLVPVGVMGELCIEGAGVSPGYLNRPELTAERFCLRRPGGSFRENRPLDPRKSVLLNQSPIYKTGDLARWLADGNIVFMGRKDHQVKIRGFRIELEEIEGHLCRHKKIKKALVMARQDRDGDKYLCAYILGDFPTGEKEDTSGLREFLAARLPDYMIPTRFVYLDALPLTPNGKVDRRALPEPEAVTGKAYRAARDYLEEKLVETWSQLLGLEKDQVGIDDNFFEIGGHSLKATIMISRLHKIFNVKIPLTEIFQGPTIEKLAAKLKEAVPHHFYTIPPVEKREYYPLSPAMKRLYLEQQMDSRSIAYNISSIVVLEGALEKDRLNEAFRKLLRRQETLRTSFQWVKGEPVQKVHDEVEFKLEYDESGNQQQAIVNRLHRPFDFTRPPLFCADLVKTGPREHLLMVSIHHSVADGTSIGILLSQFMALYNKEKLTGLRIQYKDYSLWKHRQHLATRELTESRETYWLEQFRGPIPVLNLPCDYPRPAQRSFEGGVVESRLEAETAKKLRELALTGDVTLYILGLSLFNILMMKLSGQEDIVVGTPTAGRDHADLEPLIGMFVNTLALRNYPVGSKTFRDFLQEVKERTLQAFAHQDYGFETLVKRVTAERDPGRSPIFDVFFAVQNMERPVFQVPGLRLRPYEYEGNISRFDLCFHVFEEGTQLLLVLDYCTRLFKRETVELFFKNFNEITATVLENPGILLQEIEISIEARKAEPALPRVDLGF